MQKPRTFFLKTIDAQVTFVADGDGDGDGRATAAIWRQDGKDERGERIE